MPPLRLAPESAAAGLATRLWQIAGLIAANHVWTRAIAPVADGSDPALADPVGATLVATTCALAALEEGVFRGPFFVWLRTRLGIAAAILLTAILFAALHAPPREAGIALLLGLQLGALRQTAGLGTAIAAHVTSNLVLLLGPALCPPTDPSDETLRFVVALAIGGSAIAALAHRLRNEAPAP